MEIGCLEAREAEITQIKSETPTVKTFRLAFKDKRGLNFYPGQYVEVSLRVERLRGEVRGFSISSSPTDSEYIEITVKKSPGGLITTHLHESASVGDTVLVRGPFGEFYYTDDMGKRLVLIGAGSGITPLMSIIRYIHAKNLPVKVTLLYSTKTADEIIFRKELHQFCGAGKLRCRITLTRSKETNTAYLWGRVNLRFLKRALERDDFAEGLFYLCVPRTMLFDILTYLQTLNVDFFRIKTEMW